MADPIPVLNGINGPLSTYPMCWCSNRPKESWRPVGSPGHGEWQTRVPRRNSRGFGAITALEFLDFVILNSKRIFFFLFFGVEMSISEHIQKTLVKRRINLWKRIVRLSDELQPLWSGTSYNQCALVASDDGRGQPPRFKYVTQRMDGPAKTGRKFFL